MTANPPSPDAQTPLETPTVTAQESRGTRATDDATAGAPDGTIRSGKLAGKSMWSAIWILALPVLLQQTMSAFIGLVDTVIAGRLPEAIVVPALDAVSIGSYVTWFILIAMIGLGIGGQALIARAVGAGNHAESRGALGTAVCLSVLWGGFIGVLMWLGASGLGPLCRLTPAASALLVDYVRIIAYAMPLAGFMHVGFMCLAGAGETTMPSVIAITVNFVNIFVSWALSGVDLTFGDWTLVNPFTFDLHLVGIAMGTSISYLIGAILTLAVLLRGVRDLRLERHDIRIDRSIARRIVRVGTPGFFDSLMMWSANLLVLLVIGMVAATGSADDVPVEGLQGAHLIAIRWESFSFLPGFAMGTAAGALAGQYLGAGNPRAARQTILVCTGIGCAIMGALGLVFIFGGELLTKIISAKPIHVAEAPSLLLICGLVQVFFAISMVVRQGLRGVGDTTWMFIITTFSSFAIRLPAAWFFGVYLELGLKGVWIGMSGEIVIRAALTIARFRHGGWQRIRV